MKPRLIAVPMVLGLAACASHGGMDDAYDDAAKLALYRAHIIEEVGSIPFSGSVDRWTGLGDRALAVWTSPGRAWLLELHAPCPYLDTSYRIGFDSHDGRIDAGFDSVVPLEGGVQIPCRIDNIYRIDVDAVREAERAQDSGI
ncbi:MAG TPA: DUF6491 family protein [Xanthomonadaceae bacterium]|nr:DUF6491 family protein [Xanthomonadaceae bacterium]